MNKKTKQLMWWLNFLQNLGTLIIFLIGIRWLSELSSGMILRHKVFVALLIILMTDKIMKSLYWLVNEMMFYWRKTHAK